MKVFRTYFASFFAESLSHLGSMLCEQEGDMNETVWLDWCYWLAGVCFSSNSACLPPLLGLEWRKAEIPEDQRPCWVKGIEVDATQPQLEGFLVAQMMKNLPAMQETQAWSVGWEDPLEKEMATHSSTLA